MANSSEESLAMAGEVLLRLVRLASEAGQSLQFSQLANGSEQASDQLRRWFKMAEPVPAFSPERLIDIASKQLGDAELIEVTQLNMRRFDGEFGYSMRLTRLGRAFLKSGRRFVFSTAALKQTAVK